MNIIDLTLAFLAYLSVALVTGTIWYSTWEDIREWFRDNLDAVFVFTAGLLVTELILAKTWATAVALYSQVF